MSQDYDSPEERANILMGIVPILVSATRVSIDSENDGRLDMYVLAPAETLASIQKTAEAAGWRRGIRFSGQVEEQEVNTQAGKLIGTPITGALPAYGIEGGVNQQVPGKNFRGTGEISQLLDVPAGNAWTPEQAEQVRSARWGAKEYLRQEMAARKGKTYDIRPLPIAYTKELAAIVAGAGKILNKNLNINVQNKPALAYVASAVETHMRPTGDPDFTKKKEMLMWEILNALQKRGYTDDKINPLFNEVFEARKKREQEAKEYIISELSKKYSEPELTKMVNFVISKLKDRSQYGGSRNTRRNRQQRKSRKQK
jgi:hypothetical protein